MAKLRLTNSADTWGVGLNAGDDTIYAGAGNDAIAGGEGVDRLMGEAGDDVLDGGNGNDTLNGDDGNDTLNGSSGQDTLNGGAGDDVLVAVGDYDVDHYNGGSGYDTLDYRSLGAGLVISAGAGTGGPAFQDVITGIEQFYLSSFDDQFTGAGTVALTVWGGGGYDTITGAGGADTLHGGDFDDQMMGLAGNDRLYGDAGYDSIEGGDGADRLYGGDGGDYLDGGLGDDLIYGDAGGDSVSAGAGADKVYGGDGNDAIDGGSGANVMYGDAGDDILWGGNDNDTLLGGAGIDSVDGGGGDDRLYGGGDADFLAGGTGTDTLYGEAGDDDVGGDDGADTLLGGDGQDVLRGGGDNDRLYGDAGNDILWGGDGDDVMSGAAGADVFHGGNGFDVVSFKDTAASFTLSLGNPGACTGDTYRDEYDSVEGFWLGKGSDHFEGGGGYVEVWGLGGDDLIYAGSGGSRLDGGAGDDQLVGSTFGADVFAFEGPATGHDVITRFDRGVDHIDLVNTSASFFAQLSISGNVVTLPDGSTIAVTTGDGSPLTISDFLFNGQSTPSGDDVLIATDDPDHPDYFDGGDGYDIVSYREATDWILIDLNGPSHGHGASTNDTFTNIEGFVLGRGDDTFAANSTHYSAPCDVWGMEGNDYILLGEGGGRVDGGEGNDFVQGGDGADTFVITGPNSGEDYAFYFEKGIDKVELNGTSAHSAADLTFSDDGFTVTLPDGSVVMVISIYGDPVDASDFIFGP